MSRARILVIAVIASALYFAVMHWLSIAYDGTPPYAMRGIPNSEIIPRPFERLEGSAFAVRGSDFYFHDDDGHSGILLYEDDRLLGPAESAWEAIVKQGMGRFARTKGSHSVFIFSSSDNTDPNANGRTYWAVKEPRK